MSERSSAGDVLLALLIGGAVGAVAGLLCAPRTGKETRKRVGDWLEDMGDKTDEMMGKGKNFIREKAEHFKGNDNPVRE